MTNQNSKLSTPVVFAREQSDRSNLKLTQLLKSEIATGIAFGNRAMTSGAFLHFTLSF